VLDDIDITVLAADQTRSQPRHEVLGRHSAARTSLATSA
jgi:hypothetical protein